MTIEIALALLAASIPITALVLQFVSMVKPTQFVRLETEFELFREETRRTLEEIKHTLERKNNNEEW